MTMSKDHPRSSRERYRVFVRDYQEQRLDEKAEAGKDRKPPADAGSPGEASSGGRLLGGKRRQYAGEYLGWLKPYRFTVGAVFLFALVVAGLEMIQPLFMRFIIDRVLLNSRLDAAAR